MIMASHRRQAEAVIEQGPSRLSVAYEEINDSWYNYVKGQNPSGFFGIYDVVRWDTVWCAPRGALMA